MNIFAALLPALMLLSPTDPPTAAEQEASALAGRVVPTLAPHIRFAQVCSEAEFYEIRSEGDGIVISGSGVNSLSAGLGRYLDEAGIDVSWYASQPVECPSVPPVLAEPIRAEALVPQRFFLNYCTFGYTMPWWGWEQWERLIDWMALRGVNLPLAITGEEAVWQAVWRRHGMSDEQIRAFFTGPAHLPWHRMCNIDGYDGPLPQGWIDAQAALQKKILARERALGMKPVLPAFGGHVPGQLRELYPEAEISDVSRWCGFAPEYQCHFLSPSDPLYYQIQKEFLEEQTRLFGTDHIYGFDLFNEVEAPSWDPETLAQIGRYAYGSLAAADPHAQWIQMGWMFYNDRHHWTPENVRAYLEAIPQGRVTILDYYTEHTPIWSLTEGFYGQPFIFCYLGNFGGNTRLAGPFREESRRIGAALSEGGARGIGCTLEGFGINRWMYEYVLGRAWDTGVSDDDYLAGLDRRHHSPEGFWREMADSVYLRGSFSEGSLMADHPCEERWHSWRVINTLPYDPAVLERAFSRLLSHGGWSAVWRADVAEIGTQVLANRFDRLRDPFVAACRAGERDRADSIGREMLRLLERADALAGTHPEMRMDRWIADAESWATTPEERYYYRRNAWHLLTSWGDGDRLADYASRLWNGLISQYYLPRWKQFIAEELRCLDAGESFDTERFNAASLAFSADFVERAPELPSDELTLMSYNVGTFSKYHDSLPEVAELIRETGPSLVALCELDSCNRRHPSYQLETLGGALGLEYRFGRAIPFAGGAYGNGVLSSLPIERFVRFELPQADGAEARCVLVVETPRYIFAATHLDWKGDRRKQARLINRWFKKHYGGCEKPVFLCGDMNAVPGSETLAELERCWERLSPDIATFPRSEKCIDHIFRLRSSAPAELLSGEVLTAGTETFSDHYPLVVKLKLL